MFTREDIGERLPASVYYDLDNTALEHGVRLPSEETVTSLATLSKKGVETIAVTGRDIDDSRDALIALPGRFAVIAGGAITTYIERDDEGAEVIPAAKLGLGFGYEVMDGIDAHILAGELSGWLEEQGDEADAKIRVPGLERQLELLRSRDKSENPFILPDAVFVSGLSGPEIAEYLALQINGGHLKVPYQSLFAVPVTSQSGKAEVQITAQKANKRRAIEQLAKLGLPVFNSSHTADSLADSIFIGDGLGDIPAFGAVGFSVAMADGPDKVLSAADYVIRRQREGGFNDFIARLAGAEGAPA